MRHRLQRRFVDQCAVRNPDLAFVARPTQQGEALLTAHGVASLRIALHDQRISSLRQLHLLGFYLSPRLEGRTRRRTAVRAMAVVRLDECISDLELDDTALASSLQHAGLHGASVSELACASVSGMTFTERTRIGPEQAMSLQRFVSLHRVGRRLRCGWSRPPRKGVM